MTEHIINAYLKYRNRTALCNSFSNSRAESADNAVLLSSDDKSCFICSLAYKLLIKRLDCMDVDYSCVDALSCKLFSSRNNRTCKCP